MKKIFTLIAAAFAAMSVNAGEIFSFMLNENATEFKIAGQSTAVLQDEYADYCTITSGASVEIYNAHADEKAYVNASGYVTLNGSGGSYLSVSLPKGVSLKSGDIIKLVSATQKGGGISFTDTKVTSDNMNDNNEFTVDAANEGKTLFYIWRGASKPTFKGVIVERNEGQTIAPAITVSNNSVVMTSNTEGASIYYSTQTGVTPATGTLYTAPIAITDNVTYYAVAVKEGLEVSKESSRAIEYYAIPTEATLAASLSAPEIISEGDDVQLTELSSGTFTLTSDNTLSNSATMYSKAAFQGLVKVKGNITITTTGEDVIKGIKVIGISNADDNTSAVTASGMKYTTDSNILPARNLVEQPGTVELVATAPAKSFVLSIPSQSRAKFEVYTVTADGVAGVQASEEVAPVAKKVIKNGRFVIVNGAAEYNAAGAQIK